ncbi:MAG: electron transfer flavoprotein subunit alpha [Methanobacteriota archaeon]|jgi:electron transfer flavoprotein alpha subunit|uniref:Electron transfer flavoprotein subunit alpha/FixB family protein n=1 Tax=Marine Group III euryarchaeote TaxID=2173149 RepID=A0A7J4GTJ5_9ARCH|nr:MAG: electron transfer flavoprotein subunit alpha [Euryarchaeota archaeon]HIF37309.1 electron transfer flavoprotein subunit alpha/FixB family protein [Marine Group III euryarchaeote]
MSTVIVVGEVDGNEIKNISQQVAAVASGMGNVVGIVIGNNVSEAAMKLATSKIIIADDERLEHYDPVKFTSVVSQIVKQVSASKVLIGATNMGKDLGPRLAAELEWGYLGDCLEAGNDGFVRPNFAGKILAKSNPNGPVVASIRNNAYPAGESWSGSVENFAGNIPESNLNTSAIENIGVGTVELTEANIVVSGGRGLESAENYDSHIRPLAEAMGAAAGASRAIVDAGWVPHSHQVGQTGKTVTPDLYLAIGISGAIQHLGGMSGSKFIVAINKDAEAPIFKVADYGIVGDLFEIVPVLKSKL